MPELQVQYMDIRVFYFSVFKNNQCAFSKNERSLCSCIIVWMLALLISHFFVLFNCSIFVNRVCLRKQILSFQHIFSWKLPQEKKQTLKILHIFFELQWSEKNSCFHILGTMNSLEEKLLIRKTKVEQKMFTMYSFSFLSLFT